jgi:hypothetical protein
MQGFSAEGPSTRYDCQRFLAKGCHTPKMDLYNPLHHGVLPALKAMTLVAAARSSRRL